MSTGQRAFAQRLSKQSNADVRRQIAEAASVRGNRTPQTTYADTTQEKHRESRHFGPPAQIPLCDVVEPVDFEEFLNQHDDQTFRDPVRTFLDFPEDDIEVGIIPRKCRTIAPIIPDVDSSNLNPYIKDCIRCYTSDWVYVNRKYENFSTSRCLPHRIESQETLLKLTPKQEFENDIDDEDEDKTIVAPPLAEDEDDSLVSSSNRQSLLLGDAARGSWTSSVFDLRNSQSDPLIRSLLDRTPVDQIDRVNESKRCQGRQEALFSLYPHQDEEEIIERHLPPEMPKEHMGHRILVKCLSLKLELEIEPFFGSMALYDAKEKKKISENFYFDMNPEPLKKMLSSNVVPYQDISTLSRSCVFNITYPSPDLFLVVKLEKVLQGDINECAEPYMKDEKNRDKVKSSAVSFCDRLGSYRMPFAWTAIYLMNIVNGVNSLERDQTQENTNSLGRRGSLERKGGSEKRRSWSSEDFGQSLDNFRPVTLTVNSFFKQEPDKLKEEDLYKFLLDLKRPSSVRRLKCIPGILKLDISPSPDSPKYSLTPELVRLNPYPDEKGRPTKEILEFPSKEVFAPHHLFRNLMYVYPKNVNFTNRPGSARNIACKMQFMAGEDDITALPVIFGKSSCPELSSEARTAVTYHNKSPDFTDEIKIRLPCELNEQHHLLFTFYHISCQRKVEQTPIELPVGYTWLPLFRDGKLQTGEHCLPVMMEQPPSSYSFLKPSVHIPNTKWVDNHKGIFTINVEAVSSVHAQDCYLDRFLQLSTSAEENNSICGDVNSLENELKVSILEIGQAAAEPLVHFLPLLMDKLIRLLVRPPIVAGQIMNIGQTSFEALAIIVNNVTHLLESENDSHGRNSLLSTYVSFQATLPHSDLFEPNVSLYGRPVSLPTHRSYPTRSNSNPDLSYVDLEVGGLMNRGLDRAASLRAPGGDYTLQIPRSQCRKIVHEELVLQWVVSSGTAKELALNNAWFFFELILKSMNLHLPDKHNMPRKTRFNQQFTDDISTLVTTMTSDIISRYNRDDRIQSLNGSLAFFLRDLLSVMDRGFVYSLVRTYCKQISAKISSLPDAHQLINLKLDFLRILCSHEHFVMLNLPFATPFSPSPATSPSPSVTSTNSQASYVSSSTLTETRGNFSELTDEFRQQHFLVGLLLSELATVLDTNNPSSNPSVQYKAINIIRNLLTCHDWDSRYRDPDCKARVATLYLPLLRIVMNVTPILYDWQTRARPLSGEDADGSLTQSVAMAIAGSPLYQKNDPYNQNRRHVLSEESTRHLLSCFLWVIKNTSDSVLRHCWTDLPAHHLHQLLEVLYIAVSCFEYRGKKLLRKKSQMSIRKSSDMKSKLEDVILGTSSARSDLISRRRAPPSSPYQGDKLRWRKDQMQWRHNTNDVTEKPKVEVEAEAHIEGTLASEVSLILLDSLELIIRVVTQCDSLQGLLSTVLRVLLHSLGCNQSTHVLQNMFATQRSLVFKFPELLFEEETEQCADLCLRLLRHCSSCISVVRAEAAASLYLLMRQNFEIGNNFARVKMQVTMSLSSLVGRSQTFNEGFLRRSLKTILLYAEEDSELQDTTFPEQVRDLVFNLYMILSDTVKMKEFQEDHEMLLDLMYRIAKGYQNSPDLRLTWLANMAQKHTERGNHTEGALCLVHSAALVAEYLHMLEDRTYLPVGCVTFEKISGNVLEESAVSDDVLSPDEEGICTGKNFTENGLIGLLEQSANSFNLAGMYEAMNIVYKILIPICEAHRDYKKLAIIHAKLNEAFIKIEQQAGKRVFGTYFRVGFYGAKFGDLDGEEFVYKEPTLTKLPEVSHRLENFYTERFGSEFVEVIKDSNTVDLTKLNPEKAYIQITYVEPYFDMYELNDRISIFDKNYNIKRFIYATPFTPDGRAHGELHEQYKRKTILSTSHTFPYVKTRIQVVERKQLVLTPIEVAIEDIQKKTWELATATQQEPADPKILQMVLQGCIGTTVNQGPLEVAIVFLSDLLDGKKAPNPLQNKLRLCFKDFLKKCFDALRKNKSLIGPDQRDYQRELDRNYNGFKERIMPMIDYHYRSRRLDPKHKSSPLI